jgi:hypothetical protein
MPYGFTGNLLAPFKQPGPLLRNLAKRISTYTEQVSGQALDEVKASVAAAKQIYFVGMGYHEQNMRLLMPDGELAAGIIAGTAVGECLSVELLNHMSRL